MKQISLLFLLGIVIVGCQKDDIPFNPGSSLVLEGKFQTEMTVHLKPMVMYVQNRQITDPAIIMSYLISKGYSTFFSTAATETRTDTLFTVTFGSGDSVSFKFSAYSNMFLAKKMQNSPSEWILQRRDTIITLESPIPPPGNIRCDTLGSFVNKISPVSYYVDLPFNNQRINYLVPRYALQVFNDELNFPMITMVTNSIWNYPTSNGNCTFGSRDIPNIKKDNIESNLMPKDTIVVQEKNVKMVKVM